MKENTSYKDIVKTSGVIGFVQIIQMLLGMVNSKIIAIFIGPIGYGIYGIYMAFTSMMASFASLGTNQSGVRDIAAKNADNNDGVGKCIWILKRITYVSSLFISILSALFSKSISTALFDNSSYYWGVIIVSFTIFVNAVTNGQRAILNGLRQIDKLAKSQIIGSVLGSISTILLVICFKDRGIVLYICAVSVIFAVTSWWYLRKLNIKEIKPSLIELKQGASSLIRLGFAFSITAIIASAATFAARSFLSHTFDLSSVGIYVSSWTLSNLYIGIILSAMGVDFMPRIMKSIDNNTALNQMINEQMELGVLVSGVAVVTTVIFAPIALILLYSSEFAIGAEIIRWQTLGVALRVLAYPLGYVIMGKNKSKAYMIVQFGFFTLELLLLILIAKIWGFQALGVNYFIAYLIYLIVLLVIMRRMISFKMSPLLKRILIIEWGFIAVSIIATIFLEGWILWTLGVVVILVMLLYTNYYLRKYMNINFVSIFRTKILKRPSLAPKSSCTGCMACVDSCNYKALDGYIDKDGHLYVSLDKNKCTLCRKCENVCPIINRYSYVSEENQSIPYAAWANDDEIRLKSASGGIFGAIASNFIANGGWVVGAYIDQLEVKHKLINNVFELNQLQGSKYQQGNLSGIYREVLNKLKSGDKVLFTGTPCQVAGLLCFIGDKRKENLYTIDLICGGFPSILPMSVFSKKYKITSICSFRNKRSGWCGKYELSLINDNNETINFGGHNLVLTSFASHLTLRGSCMDCQFSYKNRKADITIADFWGDTEFTQEHYKGISAVVTHNSKGEFLLHSSDITSHKTTFEKIIKRNFRLVYGKYPYKYSPANYFMSYVFKYCSYRVLLRVYGVKRISNKDIFLLPLKIINFLLTKYFNKLKNRNISKYLLHESSLIDHKPH